MKLGSLFSGYGGLDLAVQEVFPGIQTAWVSEVEPSAIKVLKYHMPDVPNLGDITKVNWSHVPKVDVIAGGSPCQDLSTAGARQGMNNETRSGLWFHMLQAIKTIRPEWVIWENVKGALSATASSDLGWQEGLLDAREDSQIPKKEKDHTLRALGRVLGDLAEAGYDAEWTTLGAHQVGAPHRRERVFVLAHTTS